MYNEAIQNLITACEWNSANFLVVSKNVFNPLIYYSHIVPLAVSLIVGFLVLYKRPRQLLSKIFFAIAGLFSVWIFFDLILWATDKPHYTIFFWSVMNVIEPLIYAAGLYFVRVFITGRDTPLRGKILLFAPLLPLLALASTKLTLLGYDLTNCDRNALEGPLTHYAYLVEIFYVFCIAFIATKSFQNIGDGVVRRKILPVTLGMALFLLTFSSGNILGSVTDDWQISQWGFFVMSALIAFLSYLVVKYNFLDLRLITAQTLVVAIPILVGTQFFFTKTPGGMVLNGIIFIASIFGGMLLVRSVKKESGMTEKTNASEKIRMKENEEQNAGAEIADSKLTESDAIPQKLDKSGKILLIVISISVVAVIISTAYKFLWLKDYNFAVESECRPDLETCFYRDCSNVDDCPPNGLENYKIFEVSANDFPNCSDNSCANECSAGSIACREIICGESEGDECAPQTEDGTIGGTDD